MWSFSSVRPRDFSRPSTTLFYMYYRHRFRRLTTKVVQIVMEGSFVEHWVVLIATLVPKLRFVVQFMKERSLAGNCVVLLATNIVFAGNYVLLARESVLAEMQAALFSTKRSLAENYAVLFATVRYSTENRNAVLFVTESSSAQKYATHLSSCFSIKTKAVQFATNKVLIEHSSTTENDVCLFAHIY